MSLVAIPLMLLSGLAATDGPGRPIAMLPVAAERVTLEAVPRLEALDDTLRRVGGTLGDVQLLDEAQTKANLAAVREMGIVCEVDDVPCLAKIALLADVDRVLVPIVRIDGETTMLRVLVVDREGRRAEASRTFTGALPADDARGILREALQAAPVAPAAVAPPRPEPAPPAPEPPSPSASVDGWWLGRVAMVGGGAVVAVAAGGAAAVVDAALATPEPWGEREGRLRLGQGLLAVAVVGGVVGVAGGVLLALPE